MLWLWEHVSIWFRSTMIQEFPNIWRLHAGKYRTSPRSMDDFVGHQPHPGLDVVETRPILRNFAMAPCEQARPAVGWGSIRKNLLIFLNGTGILRGVNIPIFSCLISTCYILLLTYLLCVFSAISAGWWYFGPLSFMAWCCCQAMEESLHHVVRCDWGVWPWRLCWLAKWNLNMTPFFESLERKLRNGHHSFLFVFYIVQFLAGCTMLQD